LAQLELSGGEGQDRLGFLYATDDRTPSMEAVIDYLGEQTGVAHWTGSIGLGICASGTEYFAEPGLAILVASSTTPCFRPFGTVAEDFGSFDAEHGEWCARHRPQGAIVHADPGNPSLPGLMRGLAGRLSGGFLVGGLTSTRAPEGPMMQVAGGVTSGGLSGVLLAPEVGLSTRLTQGCTPIGPAREISRGERNLVFEIEGRPALDVFREDIGEILARDLRRVAGYIFAALPTRGPDSGDYVVRNLVGIDPRTGIIAIGEQISSGQEVMFCRRDAQSAATDMHRMLAELRNDHERPPAGGLYFSCLARGPNLFGPNASEMEMIRETFGDLPVVGFFGNGEISNDRLYAYTGVLALFR